MMKKSSQRFWFYCKVIGFNLLFSLLLCETILYVFPGVFPESSQDGMMEFHPTLSVWYKPNLTTKYKGKCFESTLQFNELGLRSLPLQELKKKQEASRQQLVDREMADEEAAARAIDEAE